MDRLRLLHLNGLMIGIVFWTFVMCLISTRSFVLVHVARVRDSLWDRGIDLWLNLWTASSSRIKSLLSLYSSLLLVRFQLILIWLLRRIFWRLLVFFFLFLRLFCSLFGNFIGAYWRIEGADFADLRRFLVLWLRDGPRSDDDFFKSGTCIHIRRPGFCRIIAQLIARLSSHWQEGFETHAKTFYEHFSSLGI